MTPNYMVVGTPKAGTTSFCKALSLHPDVFLTNPKEPFFFSARMPFIRRDSNGMSHCIKAVKLLKRGARARLHIL